MVELTKSMLSFSWAQSLFGAQQLMNLFSPRAPGRTAGKTTAAFNSVARTTGDQLGDFLKGAYHVGDMLQQGTVDLTFNLLTRDLFNPNAMMRQSTNLLKQTMEILRFLASGEDLRLAWQEFKDKIQVFQWVRNVGTLLQLPSEGTYVSLTELVDRAYALDPFAALWALEGAGHYYGISLWDRQEDPRGLLTDARAATVPEKSMTMLHAGIGLAFAERLLEKVGPTTPPAEIRDILRRFLTLCLKNSRAGYVGAASESLGLVVRGLHPPPLTAVIDAHLTALDQEALAYFWHGVGRGIYFSPTYFLPSGRSPWRAVDMCHSEATHDLGRLNAIAGLAWAMTLVNMREPRILEAVVKRHGADFSSDGAFANGVSSAASVRQDVTPNEPFLTAFCEHQAGGSDPSFLEFWRCVVGDPCHHALEEYATLKESRRFGDLFCYRHRPEVCCDVRRKK